MTPAERTIIEAVRAGVLLIPAGERLAMKADRKPSAELVDRIREHRGAILRRLTSEGVTVTETQKNVGNEGGSGYGDAGDTPRITPDEHAELRAAGITPADVPPIVHKARGLFNGTLADVAPPRRQAARLIAEARRHDRGRAIALRDAWRERTAICWADGIETQTAARVAVDELIALEDSRG